MPKNALRTFIIFWITVLFNISLCAQAVTPLAGCPNAYVIAFKNGTNCTETPYNFYSMNMNGVINPTAFYTSSGSGKEINGIGINPIDRFIYGFIYTRTGSTSPCSFSNIRLIRVDANGLSTDLGAINPPSGVTVQVALGCMASNGDFLFYASDAAGVYLGRVPTTQTLVPGAITATYYPLTNNCPGKQFSDWAINPADGNLYAYGIFNNAGVANGTVVKIDLLNFQIDCIGTINTTEFLDISRDNFGGILFGSDDNLYGVNINTRKYYKIIPATGNITWMTTFAGSGNMRGDLASCATSFTVLPIKFTDFKVTSTADCLTSITWTTESTEDILNFELQASLNGTDFIATSNTPARVGKTSYSNIIDPAGYKYCRIKAIDKNGKAFYSSIQLIKTTCTKNKLKSAVIRNSICTMVYSANAASQIKAIIFDMTGKLIQQKSFVSQKGLNYFEMNCGVISPGSYILTVTDEKNNFSEKRKLLTLQ